MAGEVSRMRRIVVSEFVSLDGVMQAPGGREEDASGSFKHGGWGFKVPRAPGFKKKPGRLTGRHPRFLSRKTHGNFCAPRAKTKEHAGFAGQNKQHGQRVGF